VLRQRGIPGEVAADVLDRYGEVGIVDDGAFARAWITSRHHGRGLARRALAGELRGKGIESSAVTEALGELDDDTEAATARALVARKLRTERTDRPEALIRRLVGMLARKGYPPAMAVRAVRDVLAEQADQAIADVTEIAELVEAEIVGDDHDPAGDGSANPAVR
jgi:regulatory protein